MKPAPAERAGIYKPIELQIFISHIFNFRKIITVEFNCSVLGFFYGFDFFFYSRCCRKGRSLFYRLHMTKCWQFSGAAGLPP